MTVCALAYDGNLLGHFIDAKQSGNSIGIIYWQYSLSHHHLQKQWGGRTQEVGANYTSNAHSTKIWQIMMTDK